MVKLLLAVTIAMPLIGVRIIYSVAAAFADHSASGGSLPVRVIFGTLPEFLAMLVYLSGGLVTHRLARNRMEQKSGSAPGVAYTSV